MDEWSGWYVFLGFDFDFLGVGGAFFLEVVHFL